MSGLDELIGATYGPFRVEVVRDRVVAFVEATGADPVQSTLVPPMFANTVLFSAAPAFLQDPSVVPFTRSLLHSEQLFRWARPLLVGETLEVTGTVEASRARGALNLVTFSLEATSDRGLWLSGSSVFVMSTEAAARAEDAGEPDEELGPPSDPDGDALALPAAGDPLGRLRCGASRSDLMRYAAVSADRNPIHLEHDAARSAGLGGVVVHGLLMAAWMGRLATRYGTLKAMHLRFRSPLRPAVPAVVTGTMVATTGDTADLDLALAADDQRRVTARVSVTP